MDQCKEYKVNFNFQKFVKISAIFFNIFQYGIFGAQNLQNGEKSSNLTAMMVDIGEKYVSSASF